jgi:hypothetical protein
MRLSRLLPGLALAVGAACGPAASGASTAARGDTKTVTESELAVATQLNLFDYVAAERPRWLRGPGTLNGRALPIVIYMDDARLGGTETLKTLTTSSVRMLRYYEASAAQQKFTGRDIGPVIQVITK